MRGKSFPKFVVEHLEVKMYPWCVLEYKHISKKVGKKRLLFTNIKSGGKKLEKIGEVKKESVKTLGLTKACVLDPSATKTLTPTIAKRFSYFIFGGILGDNPQRFRTKKFLSSKLKFPTYNLGKKQMSTDTAVIVCKKIIEGQSLKDMKFKDGYEIEEEPGFFRELPYRYLIEKNKVIFTPGLKTLLKKLGHKL
ncbi:MAG: SAM-dependent methyltransferase [Candidatus Nanoarchaeia archaeon]